MSQLAILGGKPIREKPWPAWPYHDEAEREAAMRVADSGRWQLGAEVEAFERQFADYCQAKHAICAMNGTVTMEIGLRAFGVGPGDEVIIPTHTFIATALAVLMVNAAPVFVDSEPEHYNMDPEAVEEAITERTKAIIPVHVGGVPCDLDALLDIARRHNLRVLEDAAHAHGSEWRYRRIGAHSDLASFSFQTGKVMVSGDGGALTTDDDELAALCRGYRSFGYGYKKPLMTSNYRLTEFQGAILQAQLTRLDEQIRIREENARYLDERLTQVEGLAPARLGRGGALCPPVTRLSRCMYLLKYDAHYFKGLPKAKFIEAVRAEGVPLSNVYAPLHLLPLFTERRFGPSRSGASCPPAIVQDRFGRPIDYREVRCPVAERAYAEEGLWLQHDTGVLSGTHTDIDDVVAAVVKVKENAEGLLYYVP